MLPWGEIMNNLTDHGLIFYSLSGNHLNIHGIRTFGQLFFKGCWSSQDLNQTRQTPKKHPGNLKQTSQIETLSMETNCLANLRSLGIWNLLKCSHTNNQNAKLEKLPPYAWWCRGGTDQRPASWIWRQHQPLKKKTGLCRNIFQVNRFVMNIIYTVPFHRSGYTCRKKGQCRKQKGQCISSRCWPDPTLKASHMCKHLY